MTCLELPAVKALALALLFVAAVLPQPSLAAPPGWRPTGDMGTERGNHTATMLPNGQVLVAGGANSSGLIDTAELYDQATGTWSPTGSLGSGRHRHTATLLPNGQVLVAGGYGPSYPFLLNSAEIFTNGTWSPTGSLGSARDLHTATLLPSGKVLVAGGYTKDGQTASAELFDPAANGGGGAWSPTGSLGTARQEHTATLLPSGQVLVAGGHRYTTETGEIQLASAELFDPAANGGGGAWSPTGSMRTERRFHTATLLPSGKVLVVGGRDNQGLDVASAELYDPAAGIWDYTGSLGTDLVEGVEQHTATILLTGKVLVAGGFTFKRNGRAADVYDWALGTWSATGDLVAVRWGGHTATRLPNGKVLVAGGYYSAAPPIWLASAELYDPNFLMAKLPKALLAFYRFEGDPADASGNGRHAKVTGDPLLVPGFLEGQAYSFNGATDYLTAPLDINPNQYPKLTMGCWAKTATLAPWWQHQPLLTHDNDGFDRTIAIDWRANGFDPSGNPNAVGWSAFGGAEGQVLGAVPAILDQWTFLAVVYDQTAGTVKFQVDDMAFTKTGATLGLGRDKLLIGFRPGTSSFPIDTYFAGAIDNVFIFGDALTDEQLAYIRSGGAQAIMTAACKIDPGILFLLLD